MSIDVKHFPSYFGRACISRFQDCPLCGLDIDSIEPDPDMQGLVDRFVEGHARIRRPSPQSGVEAAAPDNVKYADVSIERGSFLVQQAMRVSVLFPKFRNIVCINFQLWEWSCVLFTVGDDGTCVPCCVHRIISVTMELNAAGQRMLSCVFVGHY